MSLRTLLLSLPAAFYGAAMAACPTQTGLRELGNDMARAEHAYGSLDLDGFITASDALRTDLPCLGEVLTRDVAARAHRIEGLRGFVDGDRRAATQSFAAARVLDPDYRFPDTLIPSGYPEWEQYEAMDVTLGGTAKVDPVIDGYLVFDGKIGTTRPTDWPTILQVTNEDGEVTVSAYVRPGQPMPNYFPEAEAKAQAQGKVNTNPDAFQDDEDPFGDLLVDKPDPDDEEDPDDLPVPPRTTGTTGTTGSAGATRTTGSAGTTRTTGSAGTAGSSRLQTGDDLTLKPEEKKKPVGLLVFSLVNVATAGVSYGVAMNAANHYRDTTTALEDLDTYRLQANLWSGVAAGTGLLAFSTGIAVGVRW